MREYMDERLQRLWALAGNPVQLMALAARYVYSDTPPAEPTGWEPPTPKRKSWRWDTHNGPVPRAPKTPQAGAEPRRKKSPKVVARAGGFDVYQAPPGDGWLLRVGPAHGDRGRYFGRGPSSIMSYLGWAGTNSAIYATPMPRRSDVERIDSLADVEVLTGLSGLDDDDELPGLQWAFDHATIGPALTAALRASGKRWAMFPEQSGTTLVYVGEEPLQRHTAALRTTNNSASTWTDLVRALDEEWSGPIVWR